MPKNQKFLENTAASFLGNFIFWLASVIGGLMVGLLLILIHGLGLFHTLLVGLLFGSLLVCFGAAIYAANHYKKVSSIKAGSDPELPVKLETILPQIQTMVSKFEQWETKLNKQLEKPAKEYQWKAAVSQALERGRPLIGDFSQPVSLDVSRISRAWIRETNNKLAEVDASRALLFEVEETSEQRRVLQDETVSLQWWQIQQRLRVLEQFLGIVK